MLVFVNKFKGVCKFILMIFENKLFAALLQRFV